MVGADKREKEAVEKLTTEKERLVGLEGRWNKEKALVDKILDLRAKLRSASQKVEGTDSKLEAKAEGAKGEPKAAPAAAIRCPVMLLLELMATR